MIPTTKAKINVWWTSIFLLRYYASTLCYFYLSYVQLIKKDLLTIQKNKKNSEKVHVDWIPAFWLPYVYSYKVAYTATTTIQAL